MPSHGALGLFAACSLLPAARGGGTCPGNINVAGYGPVSVVNAKWNLPGEPAGDVKVPDSRGVMPHMKGRSYWATACTDDAYDNEEYVALNLLGKTLRYTTDMSNAGCGCNAALYLTSLHQSAGKSGCGDHYCDANNVCGQSCAEIDIQEANNMAWHSTLHTKTDHSGVGGGYGGGTGWNGPRNWSPSQYGPGSGCIDTKKPIDVAVSFPVDGQGSLQAMTVKLTQRGTSCALDINLGSYAGMGELGVALAAGMTPIISYWSSPDMGWMDGKGVDGQGPCASENPGACSDAVMFYDFSIARIGAEPPKPEPVDTSAGPSDTAGSADGPSDTAGSAEGASSSGSQKGVCCFASQGDTTPSDRDAFCQHCHERAVAPDDSVCARSQETCESCGGTSTWCQAENVLAIMRK